MASRGVRFGTVVAVLLLGGALAAAWWALGGATENPAKTSGNVLAPNERTVAHTAIEPGGSERGAEAGALDSTPAAAARSDARGALHAATIRVVAATDGAPIAGAEVVLDGRARVTTGTDGRADLPVAALEDPSGLDLRVSAPGFVAWHNRFPPDVRDLHLELFPAVQLQVTVLLPDGRAFPEVLVSSQQRAGDQSVTRYRSTDAQGVATLRDVVPGVPLRLAVGQGMRRHHGEELVIHGDASHVIRIEQNGAIEGLVRDVDGHPVERRRVQGASESGALVFAQTDAAGAFRIEGLAAPSAYLLRCTEVDSQAQAVVYLTADEPLQRVELRLQPPPYRIEVLVRDAEDAPLANLTASARPLDVVDTPDWILPWDARGSDNTDRAGRCLLLPATAGEFEVEVWYGGASQKRRVHVAENVTTTVEFRLEETADLTVRVVDERGRPQMASVRFLPGGRADVAIPCHVETERGLGFYVAHGLTKQPGVVTVANQNTTERGAAIWLTTIPACVPGGDPIEVQLDPPGRVTARLAPVPENDWIAWSARSGELTHQAGTPLLSESRIEMYVGCPTPFDLCVQTPGGDLHVLRGLSVAPGATLDLGTLGTEGAHELRGTVLGRSGELVSGAEVEFFAPGFANELTTSTDARGNFVLERVPELDGELRASADGYVDAWQDVNAGATEGLVLHLELGGRLAGRVHVAGQAPPGRPQIHISELSPAGPTNGGSSALAHADGAFDLELDPGLYSVYVLPFGATRARAVARVEVRAGETTRLDVDLAE